MKKIISSLSHPFDLAGFPEPVRIGSSVGIAIYPSDGEDAGALVKAADSAMYNAKQVGNSYRFYGA